MKRTFVWALTNGATILARNSNKNTWNDPTFSAMYPNASVVRVAVYHS